MEHVLYRTAGQINEAMGRVYGHMGLALLTSLIVSYLVGTTPALLEFFFTGITKWIVILAPLAFIFVIGAAIEKASYGVAQLLLHSFAALFGLSFATIFAVFQMGSIVGAFMGAAVLFGTMSMYGYFTKKSLDSMGKYLFVALIALIITSLINLFLGSSLLQMIVSAVAIVVFLGLTAYDTQRIREEVTYSDRGYTAEILGALSLYINFINIFLSLLQLFGDRK